MNRLRARHSAASTLPSGGSFLTVATDNLAVASHTGTKVLPIHSAALLFVYADGQRTLIGRSGRTWRLRDYSPLANAMTDSWAAIRLSEPWAACWYVSAAETVEWPRRCISSARVAPETAAMVAPV